MFTYIVKKFFVGLTWCIKVLSVKMPSVTYSLNDALYMSKERSTNFKPCAKEYVQKKI